MAEFINPYTFVPLPESVERGAPAGHHQASKNAVCGSMTVTWTLRTPMLLPAEPAQERRKATSWWLHEGRLVVPGSTLKGVVRSLHETLMGGCLRVFDAEFLPVYRQPAVAKGPEWRLGVVKRATRNGRVTQIRLAEEAAWTPVEAIRVALGRPPQTGDSVDIPASAVSWDEGLQRREVIDPDAVAQGEQWVVMVGDSGARQNPKPRRDGQPRRFLCAVGRLAEEPEIVDVGEEAWAEYARLCEGTDDMRRIRQDPDGQRDSTVKGWRSGRCYRDVEFPVREVVGRRRMVTGKLWEGDVVWARVDSRSGEVCQLSMAAIWRVSGRGPLGERVPESLHPCRRWGSLCVSCRIFGSADTSPDGKPGPADHQAYAGHIRFGDATAVKPATTQVRLAPLSNPRPGAGQFYLKHENLAPAQHEGQLPGAYWGAERHETDLLRPVRGRKLYWHGDPSARTPPRHQARAEQRNEAMTEERKLVAAGTVLSQQITFDNISLAELGSLLLTLCPGLGLSEGDEAKDPVYALRIGGGKPLGLGSATAQVTDLCWSTALGRYTGRPPVTEPVEEFFAPRREQVRSAAGAAAEHWPTLSRILRLDSVEPTLIWYPLGGEWEDEERRDHAFRFFARTNGQHYKQKARREPIVALPDPAHALGHDQALKTVEPKNQRER